MTDRILIKGVASLLLLTVATQIFYITVVSGSDNEALRPLTWFTELIVYCGLSVASLALAGRRPAQSIVWAVLAVSGLLNVLQVGMGLSMFGPAMEAAETVPQLFGAVLAGAFFLYFLAKFLLGFAGLALGLAALGKSGIMPRLTGGAAALAGTAAIALSLLAMVDAEVWRLAAGAAGTAAAALVALTLFITPLRAAD